MIKKLITDIFNTANEDTAEPPPGSREARAKAAREFQQAADAKAAEIREQSRLRRIPVSIEVKRAIVAKANPPVAAEWEIAELRKIDAEYKRLMAIVAEFTRDKAMAAFKKQHKSLLDGMSPTSYPDTAKNELQFTGTTAAATPQDCWSSDDFIEDFRIRREATKNAIREVVKLAEPHLRSVMGAYISAAEDWADQLEKQERGPFEKLAVPYTPSRLIDCVRAAAAQVRERLPQLKYHSGTPPNQFLQGIVDLEETK